MFRVLFVLLVIIVVAFLAAWVMPEGFFKPLLQLTGSTFAMIAVFIGSLALLQWLSQADSDSTKPEPH